jgi:hypothetical protein
MVDPSKSENDKHFGTEEEMQEFRRVLIYFFKPRRVGTLD